MTAQDHKGTLPEQRETTSTTRRSQGSTIDRGAWLRWTPGLRTLLQYKPAWLGHDLVAGVVLATMLVPVGIAYAVASGLPGISGLYATIIPLLVYAMVGPSRILVLGPSPVILSNRWCCLTGSVRK